MMKGPPLTNGWDEGCFVQSFLSCKYLLSTCSVPGRGPSAGGIVMSKTKMVLIELIYNEGGT